MRPRLLALAVAALMLAASAAAIVLRPAPQPAAQPRVSLEAMIPRQFGDWREAEQGPLQVVDPQQRAQIERSYSEVLSRSYVSAEGYRVMLSIAYSDDQRAREAHFPEVCYPAQGFVVQANDAGTLATGLGEIPVRRLLAIQGLREEPLTYWFTVGGTTVRDKLENRLVHLRHGLGGRVPDGLIFRVSSIDRNPARAYRQQERFASELLRALPPADRARLSGLGGA